MKSTKKPKVAIVHDWLVGGGAERVVLELHRMFPDAPIYTSYATDEWREKLDGKVVTGWLQRFGKLRKFMALGRIWWFTHLDLSDYDIVISSSGNGEAFGVKTPADTLHINYCHTPTHYYWRFYDEYMRSPGFGVFDPIARLGLRLLAWPLRRWDYRAAQRADVILANSTHIQADIQTYYGRDSIVVHPPVDVDRFSSAQKPEKPTGFVIAGRHVPQKRIDLAVKACGQLDLPLTVLGSGAETERLRVLAGPTVTFTGRVSDEELVQRIAGARAFIFPSFEDFGIAPVEALAAGTPLIAYRAGGALDYVIEGETGTFFDNQTVESLVAAIQSFDSNAYKAEILKKQAAEFSPAAFQSQIRKLIP